MSRKIPASEYMGYDKYIGDEYIVKKNPNMIEIPNNATNGDMIKTIFRPYKVYEGISYFHVYLTEEDYFNENRWGSFEKDWWNAPYKAESEE